MEYGLADLASPYIQFKGTLGECFRESKGMGLCGIYRRESTGWVEVAKRYFSHFTHASKIITINNDYAFKILA
jgi:hypothetical protein